MQKVLHYLGSYVDDDLGSESGSAYVFDILPSAAGPDISVAPSALDFGDVIVGQSAEQIVTVSNFGSADLTLYDISLDSGINFSQTNNCPTSLLPAEACQIAVTFTPTPPWNPYLVADLCNPGECDGLCQSVEALPAPGRVWMGESPWLFLALGTGQVMRGDRIRAPSEEA